VSGEKVYSRRMPLEIIERGTTARLTLLKGSG